MKLTAWSSTIALGLVCGLAHADDSDHDKAVSAFDDARKLIEDGNCDAAIPKLEQSLRYEASVGAHFSMADCYEPRDALRAWNELREAERLAYIKHDERTKAAQDRAAALEPRLAVVRVTVPAAALAEPGFELRIDDALVDRYFADGSLAVKPGSHVIAAKAPHKRWSQQVVAQLGTPTSVAVTLENEPPPAPIAQPRAEPRRETGSVQRSAALVLGGVSLGTLAAGGVFGIVALVKKNDLDSACGGAASTCRSAPGSLDSQLAEQRSLTHLSTATLVAGGVMLAISFVLYQTSPKHRADLAVNGMPLVGSW